MAKQKEQRNLLKDQILSAVIPVLDKLNKPAAEKTQKRLNKVAVELAKKFYEELEALEKKKFKSENKLKKAEKAADAARTSPVRKKTAVLSSSKPLVKVEKPKEKEVMGKKVSDKK